MHEDCRETPGRDATPRRSTACGPVPGASGTGAGCRSRTRRPVFARERGEWGKRALRWDRKGVLVPTGFVLPGTARRGIKLRSPGSCWDLCWGTTGTGSRLPLYTTLHKIQHTALSITRDKVEKKKKKRWKMSMAFCSAASNGRELTGTVQ